MRRSICLAALIIMAVSGAVQAQQAPPSDPVLAAAKAATDAGDLTQALVLYHQAAAVGNTDAEVQLTRLYLEGGEGIETDYAAARIWAQKAATAGDSRGQVYLGKIWLEGLGVSADLDQALGNFRQADAAGETKAARYIGLIATERNDATTAAEWFRKGAEAGDITSQYYLGRAYQSGEGIARDFGAAMQWYAKAAERGDVIASDGMVGMASLYENGQGVATDRARAKDLYQRAAALGNAAATAALQRMAK